MRMQGECLLLLPYLVADDLLHQIDQSAVENFVAYLFNPSSSLAVFFMGLSASFPHMPLHPAGTEDGNHCAGYRPAGSDDGDKDDFGHANQFSVVGNEFATNLRLPHHGHFGEAFSPRETLKMNRSAQSAHSRSRTSGSITAASVDGSLVIVFMM